MEKNINNCSSKGHGNIEATFYCQICNIYICKKCEILHSNICQHHHLYKLDENIEEMLLGFCKNKNHNEKLEFYCKTHNELCCVSCLCVLKGKGKGQHSSCDVCYIEDIKQEKKNKLNDKIKHLEDLSKKLDESIDILKLKYKEINERKEKLQNKFMKIFTKLRNALNEREDNILLDIKNNFEQLFFKEDLIQKAEILPNKVKLSIEKGKKIYNEWDDDNFNKLNFFINQCINIEKNIEDINIINENIKKYKFSDEIIRIIYEENNYDDKIKIILDIIKHIANNDKLNIIRKQKEIKNEKLDLKEILNLLNVEKFFSKFDLSNTYFSILTRVNEKWGFDQTSNNAGYSPHLWEYSKTNGNQIFTIIKNEDETYFIKNIYSGNYLGTENNYENGEWKYVFRKKGENLQKFKLIYIDNDYFLFQDETGKFIDVIDNVIENGTKIQPNNKNNSLGQQWKLVFNSNK